MLKKYHASFFRIAVIVLFCSALAGAQPTEFTYQGRLLKDGVAASGSHDFEFTLYDAASGGSQVGSTVTLTGIAVENGVFSVRLNFGNVFPGAGRFLEIRVRDPRGGEFSTLTPRQAVTSSPYAIRSINAGSAANATNATTAANALSLGGIAAGEYVLNGDARLFDARPPLAGSTSYIQNTIVLQPGTTNFNISGSGTVGETLSANVVSAATQFNIGGSRVLSGSGGSNLFVGIGAGVNNTISGNGGTQNAFFGTSAGNANSLGRNNAFFGSFTGFSNTTGQENSFFGQSAGSSNTDGFRNTLLGQSAGVNNSTGNRITLIGAYAEVGTNGLSNATAIGANAVVTQSNSLVLGSVNGLNGALADTLVGIGTTAPVSRLTVAGSGGFSSLGAARFDLLNRTSNVSYFQHVFDDGRWQLATGNLTRILVEANGNVGIGTGAADKLQVAGNIRIGTGTTGCVRDADGSVIAGTCSSDARLKQSISYFPRIIDRLIRLRPVHFYWRASEFPEKAFGPARSYGLLAQEVEEVLPEMVSADEEGFKAVNYSKLPLLMLQAIRDLKAEIDALGLEIEQRKRREKDADETREKMVENQQKQIEEQKEIIRRQQAEINALKSLVCEQHPAAELCQPSN